MPVGISINLPLDSDLVAIADLATVGLIERAGNGSAAIVPVTAYGKSLLAAIGAATLTSLLEAGSANRPALLGADGRLPFSQLSTEVLGAAIFGGTWNPTTNTPTLASGIGTTGKYYVCSTGGTTILDGVGGASDPWGTADVAIFDGTVWRRIDARDAVLSVNGQIGIVSLTAANVGAIATGGECEAIEALSTNGLIKRTGATTVSAIASTSYGESIINAADAAALTTLIQAGGADRPALLDSGAKVPLSQINPLSATELASDAVTDVKIGNRTATDATFPATLGPATLTTWLTWFTSIIKRILGTTNWYDAPPITLTAANTHVANTSNPHGVTAAQVGAIPTGGECSAIEALIVQGFIVRTGGTTVSARNIAVASAPLTVSNGNGVSGNPTIDINAADGSNRGTISREVSGTWTPIVQLSTPGTSSFSYSIQSGNYARVGNLVFIRCVVELSSFTIGTGSGNIRISGLPFAPSSNSAGSVDNIGNFTPPANIIHLAMHLYASQTYTDVIYVNTSGAVAFLQATALSATTHFEFAACYMV